MRTNRLMVTFALLLAVTSIVAAASRGDEWTEEDAGRLAGAAAVLGDEVNCRSRWSDDSSTCAELDFLVIGDQVLERAFKVPSPRNVAERAPYMHAGQFTTLLEVLEHYNRVPKAPAGQSELEPLHLSAHERRQTETFPRSLSGGVLG